MRSILIQIPLMILASALIIFGISWGLGYYTKHNIDIPIPEIRGKSMQEAIRLLHASGLDYEVVDSVYDRNASAGTILDVVPAPGHKVKQGRIIFLKIYAYEERKIAIPYISDVSARTAIGLLRGLGFQNIETREVAGDNIDLFRGIELRNGHLLKVGDLVARSTPLVVLIEGNVETPLQVDDLISRSPQEDYYPTSPLEVDSTYYGTEPAKKTDEPESWW